MHIIDFGVLETQFFDGDVGGVLRIFHTPINIERPCPALHVVPPGNGKQILKLQAIHLEVGFDSRHRDGQQVGPALQPQLRLVQKLRAHPQRRGIFLIFLRTIGNVLHLHIDSVDPKRFGSRFSFVIREVAVVDVRMSLERPWPHAIGPAKAPRVRRVPPHPFDGTIHRRVSY